MRIENQFVVRAPIERVWEYVLDVERVAPCMPGAQLTETVDETTWKGKTTVKVGPVSLSFAGTVQLQERDDSAHTVRLSAKGMEQRGKGAASATVDSRLEEVPEGTRVFLEADLTITGAAAQYGRGMLQDVSQRLAGEFARCLEANMLGDGSEASHATPAPPVSQTAPEEPAPQSAPAQPARPVTSPQPAPQAPSPTPSPAAAGPSPAPPRTVAGEVKGIRLFFWALWRAVVRFFRRLFGGRGA